MSNKLAVQSYCFRDFKDNAKVAELVKACGLNGIELCGVHVDFQNQAAFKAAAGIYRQAGVSIVSTGVNGLSGDEAKERNLLECVRTVGAKVMSVSFGVNSIPNSFRMAEKLTEEFDVRLGIHNHGGRHWLGCCEILDWVFKTTSPRIGLCLDTAWALHSHEDPLKMVERYGARLYALHVKDFTFDRAGRHQDVVVGTGNLNLPELGKRLQAVGFQGEVVLEYEGDAANPVPALKDCVGAMRAAIPSLA
jgi:sugar phosphate isomerase/epimerase